MLAPMMWYFLSKPISMYFPNRLLLSLRVVLAFPMAWIDRKQKCVNGEVRARLGGRHLSQSSTQAPPAHPSTQGLLDLKPVGLWQHGIPTFLPYKHLCYCEDKGLGGMFYLANLKQSHNNKLIFRHLQLLATLKRQLLSRRLLNK